MFQCVDFGHIRIKEMIRTLEANTRNSNFHLDYLYCSPLSSSLLDSMNNHMESPIRQRPLSQPCTRTETNAILTNSQQRQFGTTTDDAKLLSSATTTPKQNSPPSSNCLNTSHRSDVSLRSITK